MSSKASNSKYDGRHIALRHIIDSADPVNSMDMVAQHFGTFRGYAKETGMASVSVNGNTVYYTMCGTDTIVPVVNAFVKDLDVEDSRAIAISIWQEINHDSLRIMKNANKGQVSLVVRLGVFSHGYDHCTLVGPGVVHQLYPGTMERGEDSTDPIVVAHDKGVNQMMYFPWKALLDLYKKKVFKLAHMSIVSDSPIGITRFQCKLKGKLTLDADYLKRHYPQLPTKPGTTPDYELPKSQVLLRYKDVEHRPVYLFIDMFEVYRKYKRDPKVLTDVLPDIITQVLAMRKRYNFGILKELGKGFQRGFEISPMLPQDAFQITFGNRYFEPLRQYMKEADPENDVVIMHL